MGSAVLSTRLGYMDAVAQSSPSSLRLAVFESCSLLAEPTRSDPPTWFSPSTPTSHRLIVPSAMQFSSRVKMTDPTYAISAMTRSASLVPALSGNECGRLLQWKLDQFLYIHYPWSVS